MVTEPLTSRSADMTGNTEVSGFIALLCKETASQADNLQLRRIWTAA